MEILNKQQAEQIVSKYFTQENETFFSEIQYETRKNIAYFYFETTAPNWANYCKRYYYIAIHEFALVYKAGNVIDKTCDNHNIETAKQSFKNNLIHLLSKTI